MEYTQWVCVMNVNVSIKKVLILVVMEYTQWDYAKAFSLMILKS